MSRPALLPGPAVAPAVVVALALAFSSVADARQVGAREGMTAFIPDRPDWCQRTVEVTVRGASAQPFQGDRVALHRLLTQVRFTLEEECPSARATRLYGFAGSQRVFEGWASQASGWTISESRPVEAGPRPPVVASVQPTPAPSPQARVAAANKTPTLQSPAAPPPVTAPPTVTVAAVQAAPPMPAPAPVLVPESTPLPVVVGAPAAVPTPAPAVPPAQAPAPSVAAAPTPAPPVAPAPAAAPAPAVASTPPARTLSAVQQCDALAAHPDDPESFARGVTDARLNAVDAIAACEGAIRQDRQSPRLAFQLARGYLKAGRLEDATEQLLAAARQHHGGALAYLADLHVEGAPGIEADPMLARSLYASAVAAGFKPAQQVLAQFEDYTAKSAAADEEEPRLIAKEKAEARERAAAAEQAAALAKAEESLARQFVHADIVMPILKGDLGAINANELYAKQYVLAMAENIGQACNAHFTSRDISQLKLNTAMKHVDVSPQAAGNQVMGMMLELIRMRDNTASWVRQRAQADIDQQHLPEEAFKDSIALMGHHACNSEGLTRFSRHLVSFVSGAGATHVSANDMSRNCLQNSGFPNQRMAQNFCTCFLGAMSTAPISQKDRNDLAADFSATSGRMIRADGARFDRCRQ